MIDRRTALFSLAALATVAALFARPGYGEGWKPERNVELIVPTAPGGSLDATGRVIQGIWRDLNLLPTTSTLTNRAGGGHAVAYAFLARLNADPHQVCITASALLANHINGRSKVTYTDVTPLAILMSEYLVVAVRQDSPIRTGQDLVQALRNDPQSLVVGLGSALGGPHHVGLGAPLQSAGADVSRIRIVSFKSGGASVTALLGSHVDVVSSTPITLLPHIESGKLRPIVVSAPRRLEGALAGAATWEELGLRGVFEHWRGAIGAPGLSAGQVSYWEAAFRKAVDSDEFRRYGEKNLLHVTYRDAKATREFMEQQYQELKSVMGYLGLVRR